MKNILATLAPLVFFLCANEIYSQPMYQRMIEEGTHTLADIQYEAELYFDEVGRGRGTGFKQWKRWEYEAEFRQNADGTLRSEEEELQQWEEYIQRTNNQSAGQIISTCESDWQKLGPTSVIRTSGYNPGIGRVTSLAVHPSDPQTIIVGAHTGGVWKTEDEGSSWSPLSDEFVNLSVWALEIAPSDPEKYYWGGSGSTLYRSEDGGSTWKGYSTPVEGGIHYLAVHPENSEEIWVAGSVAGLYRTINGGEDWNFVAVSSVFQIYDIEFHPTRDSVVYASGRQLWRSTDYGQTFQRLDFDVQEPVIMLATTEADPDRLYILTSPDGSMGGIYISQNMGDSITLMDHEGKNYLGYDFDGSDLGVGQAPRDMDIVASATDSNLVFVSGINIWRSLDGAETFDILSYWYKENETFAAYSHADIDITKMIDGVLYIGSDGGIYRMENLYANRLSDPIKDLSDGLNIHQVYKLDVAQSPDEIITLGSQDNGSSLLVNDQWRNYIGADGMDGAILNNDIMTTIGATQNGNLYRTDNLGQSLTGISAQGIEDLLGRGNWVTPIARIGNTSFLVGYGAVHRSDDLGESFYQVSPRYASSPSSEDDIREIEVFRDSEDIIYCTNRSALYRTVDNAATWHEVSTPLQTIIDVAVHPTNSNLVAVSGFQFSSRLVYISVDGAQSWTEFPGLPDLTARSLVWQEDQSPTLYAGMTYGLFKLSLEEDEQWVSYNFNLPNVAIRDLKINHETRTLYAATYGRGVWKSPLCQITTSTEPEIRRNLTYTVSPNPVDMGFTLQGSQSGSGHLRLYDSQGRVVFRQVDCPEIVGQYIRTDHLPSGMYYLRISRKSGTEVHSISVQH